MEAFIQVLTYIGYIIVAILCLMFMIIVHESGHYFAGKMLGFKIDEFSIGFGPAIFKRKNKKTGEQFAIRWIPMGGYCAFYGETDDDSNKDKAESQVEDAKVFDELDESINDGSLAKDSDITASKDILDENDTSQDGVTAVASESKAIPFNDQKPWKRIIVFIAGALCNYLSAIVLIAIFFMTYGDYTPTVTAVYDIGSGIEQHFEVGDEILKVEGKSVYTLIDMYDVHKKLAKGEDTKVVTIRRDGEIKEITINKGSFVKLDEDDKPLLDSEGNIQYQAGYGIQIGRFGRIKFGFFESIGRAFVFSFKIVGLLFTTLGGLFTGAIGIKGNVGGPVTTITTIAMVSQVGFDAIMYAVCAMSATLAVMNLLPLPALDGSKVVFTLIEWVRGKPINRKVENTIHLVGLFVLFGMTILFDILNFV